MNITVQVLGKSPETLQVLADDVLGNVLERLPGSHKAEMYRPALKHGKQLCHNLTCGQQGIADDDILHVVYALGGGGLNDLWNSITVIAAISDGVVSGAWMKPKRVRGCSCETCNTKYFEAWNGDFLGANLYFSFVHKNDNRERTGYFINQTSLTNKNIRLEQDGSSVELTISIHDHGNAFICEVRPTQPLEKGKAYRLSVNDPVDSEDQVWAAGIGNLSGKIIVGFTAK